MGGRGQPDDQWGPGLGDEIARSAGSGGFFSGTYVYPAEGFVYRDGEVTRYAGAAASTAGPQRGAFRFFGWTITTSWRRWSMPRASSGWSSPTYPCPIRWPRRPSGSSSPSPPASTPRRRRCVSSSAPSSSRALRPVDPEFTKVINFGMFAIPRGAADSARASG